MTFTNRYADINGFVITFSDVDKLPKTKENALVHYVEMTCQSWTFDRMTQAEKERCINALLWTYEQGMLKGSFRQRWDILNAVYNAYLTGLGYTGAGWRD